MSSGAKINISQNSQANITNGLTNGLQMMGKVTMNVREWTGKFAEEQHKHQYPVIPDKKSIYGEAMNKQFQKFKLTIKQCSLCLTQKPKDQFYHMCKCHHQYCYNCLNTYAISRIEDTSPVICPQQDCHETMPLSSQVYKYLPDQIKIKFLNNRHVWKNKAETLCQRCLEPKHSGECQYALKPSLIQNAYHYRQCSKCKTQVNLTQGKRRVQCPKCGHQLCYFCGTDWRAQKAGQNHVCGNKGEMLRKQQQFNESVAMSCANCVSCCNCDCDCCECNCCECDCCRNCDGDFCCQVCFHCDTNDCGLFCILWNIVSVPFRLILSTLVIAAMIAIGASVIIIPIGWIIMSLFAGFTVVTCQIIGQLEGCAKLLGIIFCPFLGFYGWLRAMIQTSECVTNIYGGLCGMYCGMIGNLWVDCSPKQCLS